MKIENKLTLAHMRLNKKRTALTIIGIIISVSLILSVFIGIASLLNYNERMIASTKNAAHFMILDMDREKIEILKKDNRIKNVGLVENGRQDTSGVRIEGAESLRHATAYINWYNKDMFRQMYIDHMDGRFPKSSSEILINQSYIDKNGFDWKIGDTVTLETGRRHKKDETDIFHITNTSEYKYGEVFDFYKNRNFKIVGIIKDNVLDYKVNQMYSVCDDNSVYTAYIQLNKVTPFSMMTINEIASELGVQTKQDLFINNELLATHLCGSLDSDIFKKYIPMGFAILFIILIAAFMLIYNSFGISITERTRYLGMLSSVGATKKQKRNSSYFEGLLLGLIGIPIGTISGILIMSVGIKIINHAEFTSIPVKFVLPFRLLAIALLISALTIFISLYIPAKKASQATAIESIRQSKMIHNKNTKSPFLIKKLFGFEGVLAYKNLKRNKNRSSLITISIAVSSILFLCVNYYCSLTTALVIDDINKPYQVEFGLAMSAADRKSQVLQDIKSLDHVQNVYSIEQNGYAYGKADTTFSYDRKITEENNTTKKYKHLWDNVSVILNYINDEDFDALCKKNNIDPKPYYKMKGRRQKCVIMNNIDHKENGDKVFNKNIIGGVLTSNPYGDFESEELRAEFGLDELSKEEQEAYVQELIHIQTFVDIAGTVEYDESNYVCKLNPVRTVSAYAPFSMHPAIVDIDGAYKDDGGYYQMTYGIETDQHKQVSEEIRQYFDGHPEYTDNDSVWVIDSYGYALDSIQQNKVIKLFMYGFILLITMITFANIINTITTSIASRKREFAIIKSVGITPKNFKKMIAFESLFYGIDSLLIAIPVSIGIDLILNRIVGDGKIPYEYDFMMYFIMMIAVLSFVGTTMIYSIRKVKNDNIIENIKKDIF